LYTSGRKSGGAIKLANLTRALEICSRSRNGHDFEVYDTENKLCNPSKGCARSQWSKESLPLAPDPIKIPYRACGQKPKPAVDVARTTIGTSERARDGYSALFLEA